MVKNCVYWHPVRCKNIVGDDIYVHLPQIIDFYKKGSLISEILDMQKRNPISFEAAINIISDKQSEAFDSGQIGFKFGQYSWYAFNFTEYISSLGYHIELTGDEFELPNKYEATN